MSSLSQFMAGIYRYHKVILKAKRKDKNTIEVLHFHNLGDKGKGKTAMCALIRYATKRKYKSIILEVYAISVLGGGQKIINEKLVSYYQEIGFVIYENENNNIKMEYHLCN